MWNSRGNEERSVAVAVDKDKGSHKALKWAIEHILIRGQTVTLIHVNQTPSSSIPTPTPTPMVNNGATNRQESDDQTTDLFLPFRCFCAHREIQWDVVTLQDPDIAKALIEYVSYNRVGTLLLGASSKKSGIYRVRATENRSHDEISVPNTDISFVGSGGLSTNSMFSDFYDDLGSEISQRLPKRLSLQEGKLDPLCS
ncbi:hypothetical protein F0562_009166 [Nyssa sinensis]|uniref:RING-type E3 ubiquitin transferase n=1 Tax=Nyssa sinensis TaxID=561372 RepID=A0A5J4ZZ33_9ASTE|nr:hypothetical protein F0562_009166 [Nyssa sinensis]